MTDGVVRTIATAIGGIAIREEGPPGAPELLLCQRFRGTMEDWDPRLVAALALDRRVIRFDMPGIGASAGEVPETVQGMATVVPALLDALGLDGSTFSAGRSVATSRRRRR